MELIVLGWLLCGLIAYAIAAPKGAGCLWFFLGALLGPIGIVCAIIDPGKTVQCPWCRSRIHPKAIVCPKCSRETGL